MSNSKLVSVNVPAHSSNYTVGRSGRKIEYIAIHHMAGVLSAVQCGNIFARAGRNGSSHYGVGKDGEIGQYIDEANTAWCNSNWDSNCKSVTIETSNSSTGGNWPVSDNVLNNLIKLVADIAKRNNLGTLVKGKNVVWHRMYTATTCPGDYLLSKMDYIISEANKINNGESQTGDATNIEENHKIIDGGYLVKVTTDCLNIRNGAGTNFKINGQITDRGTYTIVETQGNWGKLKSGAGWICLDYTNKNTNSNSQNVQNSSKYVLGLYVVNTAAGLNVRSGPGTNYSIKKAYTNGTRFDTYELNGEWAKTPSGWVNLQYCKLVKQY